jgi:GT2 family glycosyltransferase
LVSVIIPTYNRKEKLIRLVKSIRRSNYPQSRIEVIIVDDASTDGTTGMVKKFFPEVNLIINTHELFPSKCRNIGLEKSHGDYLFLVDDDNILDENTIRDLVMTFDTPTRIGIVGPVAFYNKEQNIIWCAGGKINAPLFFPTHVFRNRSFEDLRGKKKIEVDYVPNAFMIKKEVLDHSGLFESLFPIGWEEVNFALRVKKNGYKVIVQTKAKIFHDVPFALDIHITKNRAFWRGRSRTIFYRKHEPIRCSLLFMDILGFGVLVARIGGSYSYITQYFKGVINGLATKLE